MLQNAITKNPIEESNDSEESNSHNEESNGNELLKTHWSNAHVVNHDYTMNRYDYPQYVRDWIKNNWIKYDNRNWELIMIPNTMKLLFNCMCF